MPEEARSVKVGGIDPKFVKAGGSGPKSVKVGGSQIFGYLRPLQILGDYFRLLQIWLPPGYLRLL